MTLPLPATDSEKNAWPKAYIHSLGSARPLGFMVRIYLYPSDEPSSVKIYTPSARNSANSTGIMTLLAFSMPPAMPNDMMAKLATIATIIHMFAPHALAVPPNVPFMTSISCPMENRSPVNDMKVYLNI